jgi:hypothetical protein
MGKKIIKYKLFFLLLLLLFLLLPFGFLYSGKYLNCITKDFTLCLKSKKYTSATGKFSFRHPSDYPMSFKTGDEMVNQYNFEDEYIEWVNFSWDWYPNAGGERLGSVVIKNETDFKEVEEYANKILSDFEALPKQFKGTPPKIEYLKVAGKDAVRISRSQQPSSFNPPSDDFVLIYKGELYQIGFDYNGYYHKKPVEYYLKSREIILSTLTLY